MLTQSSRLKVILGSVIGLLILVLSVDGFLTPRVVSTGRKSPTKTATTTSIVSSNDKKFNLLYLSSSIVSNNEDLLPGITAINNEIDNIHTQLQTLRTEPYFRYYSVDILGSCEYMPQELFECYTETCEIYPEDEDIIPLSIRTQDMDEHEFELDGWSRWDMPNEDYYDVETFPEGYTNYDGSEIWAFIHDRICFKGYEYDDNHWKADFNKAVSGIHSVISAQVIRGIKEKVDNGEPFTDDDPVAEFNRRLSPTGTTPLAIENLYFVYMLLLTAVSKVKDRLISGFSTANGDNTELETLKTLLNNPIFVNDSVAVASHRLFDHVQVPDNTLWEARMRSRDLLRIMNCVQCNKCRFHGKIAMLGLTTALSILVGHNGTGGNIELTHRVELAALVTTLHKCSTAILFCRQMQQ